MVRHKLKRHNCRLPVSLMSTDAFLSEDFVSQALFTAHTWIVQELGLNHPFSSPPLPPGGVSFVIISCVSVGNDLLGLIMVVIPLFLSVSVATSATSFMCALDKAPSLLCSRLRCVTVDMDPFFCVCSAYILLFVFTGNHCFGGSNALTGD